MSYKLIAIDMDGTLLTPSLEISRRTIETVRNVIEKGVVVTLSTGRMYSAAIPFANTLQLDVPLITCNGALVKCAQSGKEYSKKTIPSSYCKEVIQYCHSNNLSLSIYKDDKILIENNTNLHIHQHMDMSEPQIIDDIYTIFDDSIIKILIGSKDKNSLDYYTRKLYEVYKNKLNFYFSLPYFVEIIHKDSNKKNALKFLATLLNVRKEEIISIGDNFNDMGMIEYAGLGVAMGNAPNYLKQVADFVTVSNDEDGVNYVLEKFILNK